jgi:hypothetical protein
MGNYNPDMKGKLISSFDEYRDYVSTKYHDGWKMSNEEKIYDVFGKPESYPFVMIEMNGDPDDPPFYKELVKVYI